MFVCFVQDVARFKESGADHVLTKPLDMDKFWKILIGERSELSKGCLPD